ncbi:YdcF family protein [soil metagenome]
MNDVVTFFGIQSWKPFLTVLLLPPVPFLVLLLVGARLILPRRGLGWTLVAISVIGIWLTSCSGFAQLVSYWALSPPKALTEQQIGALEREVKSKTPIAVVVLGSGREQLAPEYGVSNLTPSSVERLRYGLWLGRQTGAPVGFAGGYGWAQGDGISEAEIAGRIAAQEFGKPLRWQDTRSRDTRENASFMLSELRPNGVKKILLVTHGWHMQRALRNFRQASTASGDGVEIVAAPMGLAMRSDSPAFDWVPSSEGFTLSRSVLREVLAKLMGA